MKDVETRCFEMFQRVNRFGADEAAFFASRPFVTSYFDEIQQLVADIQAHAGAQVAGRSSARQFTQSKAAAREELLRDLAAVSRTARSMSRDFPGLEEKFRFDPRLKDQELLTAARTLGAEALPLKAEFVKRGLRPDFLEDLTADASAFEQALSSRTGQQRNHVDATATIDDLIERGLKMVRELDPIIRNLFDEKPGKLAAWMSASRVERAPRRTTPAPAPAPAA